MKRLTLVLCCLLAVMLPAANASAAPITLSIGDAYYLGSINDGIPSSLANEAEYINYLNDLAAGQGDTTFVGSDETYNRVGSTLAGPFPNATATGAFKVDTSNNFYVPSGGFAYILSKYDASQAGSLVWFVQGVNLSDGFYVPTSFNGHGLSHISGFNPTPSVPDGGVTSMLLGSALVGLAALRRRFNA